MKTDVYPLTLPRNLLGEARRTAKATGLSLAETVRQATKLGLPQLREQLDTRRITNVEPLPAKIARRLYSERDDDAEGTRRFMAAQSKSVEE